MRDKNLEEIKKRLEQEVKFREKASELSYDKPDPLIIAKRYNDEYVALISALFAYGNAKQIVKFLDSLDFSLLDATDEKIEKELKKHYYRFQNSDDVVAIFKTLKRLKAKGTLEEIVVRGFRESGDILGGLWELIGEIERSFEHESRGYRFLIGRVPKRVTGVSPFKRYMLFFRWMVRDGALDLGLWSRVDKSQLIIPLDTHTFNVSKRLGLLERKSYDLKSAIELTETLKSFDPNDPLKYDFAIYRLGQEKLA